jgi:hypothetical protein
VIAKLLCYTSPGRGHLFPTVPVLLEMVRRGHDVSLVTLSVPVWRRVAICSVGCAMRPSGSSSNAPSTGTSLR